MEERGVSAPGPADREAIVERWCAAIRAARLAECESGEGEPGGVMGEHDSAGADDRAAARETATEIMLRGWWEANCDSCGRSSWPDEVKITEIVARALAAARAEGAREERERVREWLRHDDDCKPGRISGLSGHVVIPRLDCSCGLDAALRRGGRAGREHPVSHQSHALPASPGQANSVA